MTEETEKTGENRALTDETVADDETVKGIAAEMRGALPERIEPDYERIAAAQRWREERDAASRAMQRG